MNYGELAEKFMADRQNAQQVLVGLSITEIDEFVAYLKEQVNLNWWIDANRSIEYADAIIAIAQVTDANQHYGLGLMARGESLRFLGHLQEAWQHLEEAADRFQQAGDVISWARTCTVRLGLAPDLRRTDEALSLAQEARKVFVQYEQTDFLLRLDNGLSYLYILQGRYQDTLDLLFPAIDLAEASGGANIPLLRYLYSNLGYALAHLTRFREARDYYLAARHIAEEANETVFVASTTLNLERIAQDQGNYSEALALSLEALETLEGLHSPLWVRTLRATASCYLQFNRFEEAVDLAQTALNAARHMDASTIIAETLIVLALAQANLQHFDEALEALDEAAKLYQEQDAIARLALLDLYRAQIHYLQGDHSAALHFAQETVQHFATINKLHYSQGLLVRARTLLALGNFTQAQAYAQDLLATARSYALPILRYQAHVLLGKVARYREQTSRAIRYFKAATNAINRVQRGLAMPLKTDFMQDKDEAFHELMDIYLANDQAQIAFETLEHHKAQVFWEYLIRGNQLRWALDMPGNSQLVDDLEQLRAEHHWYYQQLYPPFGKEIDHEFDPSFLQEAIQIREKQIRRITERLYLQSQHTTELGIASPGLADIQTRLAKEEILIEYFIDGGQVWAFALSTEGLSAQRLALSTEQLRRWLQQFQMNINTALQMGAESPLCNRLIQIAQQILSQLYDALVQPLQPLINAYQRLIIVPYGLLHYLPFHLLYHDGQYLAQCYQFAVLPAASFRVRELPQARRGALTLANSYAGNLPATLEEAQFVHELLGGELLIEEQATRDSFNALPCTVLHIAAHGEFRLDHPELSSIALADGQLLTDDLFQHDMSYELVTLSACETGRAKIAPGDELIGLGRGFLYNGAGALLVSLWRSDDQFSYQTMTNFYEALTTGVSKSAALQQAHLSMLNRHNDLHPAFWGAFQLIGDPRPLSPFLN